MDALTAAPSLKGIDIARADPCGPELDPLFARHVKAMHADTPPQSIHMLPREDLRDPGIAFYVLRDGDGRPLGMGALKRLSPQEGEIKSMHVLAEARGRGLSRLLLDHIAAEARAAGMTRLNLETGVQPTFLAARALYARAGFVSCGPFAGYGPDPNSLFMTLAL